MFSLFTQDLARGEMTKLSALPADTRGATALEYALIAAIIAVVTIGAMQGVGKSLLQNFAIIVDAARDTPQPMAVAESSLPAAPMPKAPTAARTPKPDLDEEESSASPDSGTDIPEADDFAEAEGIQPMEPGIAPSDPALGPGEDEFPVAVLIAPPGQEHSTSRRPGDGAFGRGHLPAAPPGRESSEEGGTESVHANPEQESPAAVSVHPTQPFFTDLQKQAIRSGFILFLWAAFAIGLANLIWRIATRKAHEREVEDQLEGWQPASFG